MKFYVTATSRRIPIYHIKTHGPLWTLEFHKKGISTLFFSITTQSFMKDVHGTLAVAHRTQLQNLPNPESPTPESLPPPL